MERIIVGPDLEIRPSDYLALARGQALSLSVRELQLLTEMARLQGRVVQREELYERVWGRRLRDDDRSVDVYVHKLRCKLSKAFPDRAYIHTHFGLGYRFSPEPAVPFTTVSQVENGSVTSSVPSADTLGS